MYIWIKLLEGTDWFGYSRTDRFGYSRTDRLWYSRTDRLWYSRTDRFGYSRTDSIIQVFQQSISKSVHSFVTLQINK